MQQKRTYTLQQVVGTAAKNMEESLYFQLRV